ncbi:MAG: hydantoinase B/oxoprolinase family protein [Chromatiales bacterium]|nr:hydantoinase B/oxoprolinase family protein [Chromatiales bacterium]
MNAIELGLFASRISAICDEMGAVLRRSAFSPNIRDRLDFSCAVFGADGRLGAQAAHIPVHLGSMAYAMRDLVRVRDWQPGDQLIVNDPYLGGTHLPDVTLIAPVFTGGRLAAFVANRAHHADIGAEAPGSMPISTRLEDEGRVIAPRLLIDAGRLEDRFLSELCADLAQPEGARGDFSAQISANRAGIKRLESWLAGIGFGAFERDLDELNAYAERLARAEFLRFPPGRYAFVDRLDDDGQGSCDLAIAVTLEFDGGRVRVDFTGTAAQVAGNVNCPRPVTAAAVYYVFRCLLPEQAPACAGLFAPIELVTVPGSLVDAARPAAVAAGNVETSSRIVDALLGAAARALPGRIPAASQGTMNNLALGSRTEPRWAYYETIAGGMGAGPAGGGLSAVQTHMTNTLNTPVEVLESSYPLRVTRYALREGSGGAGARRGGDGVVREFEALAPMQATVLSERRRHSPWGLDGGAPGRPGRNRLNGRDLPGKVELTLKPGDRLTIETPGGGGFGGSGHR